MPLALIVLLPAGCAAPRASGSRSRERRRDALDLGRVLVVMFTAFMVALTLTRVANVLVTMALAPLLTALIARVVLGHRLPTRTWVAIAVAGIGIAWMYANEVGAAIRAMSPAAWSRSAFRSPPRSTGR